MSAPTLILLGSEGSRSALEKVSFGIRDQLTEMRPDLEIYSAFLHDQLPSPLQVAARLARQGVAEAIVVPLMVSEAYQPDSSVLEAVRQMRTSQPSLHTALSRPLGPMPSLLNVLDRSVRAALRATNATELDGIVLSAHGSKDHRSATLLGRLVRQWSNHHKLPCVLASAAGHGPGVGAAIGSLRAQGRRHIAVGSLFVTADDHFYHQARSAIGAGAIAVSAPMGPEPELANLALERYLVTAIEMVDLEAARKTSGSALPVGTPWMEAG